ncbi:indolethylamine N-methyltransferase-like [Mytilus californianus]|uniref:indolethylamine N-methyltransferase-like n=1 Tax=Mytilus californianus TaxID=6549 RepID=UPI00224609EE|nr:indolethylamine N-methyltransferase-like [Mytilus californianus]
MATLTSTDYSNDFDVNWYFDTYYSAVAGGHEEGDFLTFILLALHDIFDAGNVHGNSLLDIDTGPTIHTVISACPYVQNIVLSDYSKVNREALEHWKDDKLQTGSALCKFVLGLEGGMIHVVVGVLDQTFYRVGNFRFSCLKITESN